MILLYRKSACYSYYFLLWVQNLVWIFAAQLSPRTRVGATDPQAVSLVTLLASFPRPASSSREKIQSRPSGNCRRSSWSISLSSLVSRMCSGEWREPAASGRWTRCVFGVIFVLPGLGVRAGLRSLAPADLARVQPNGNVARPPTARSGREEGNHRSC